MKNSIFISYRRADLNNRDANLLHDALENEFGKETVFLDREDLHGGYKWREILNKAGDDAKLCIVVIGSDWMGKKEDGTYRLDNPNDVVRQEIEYAIAKKIVLLPVTIQGAELPKAEKLPASLHPVLASQGIKLNFEDWNVYKLTLLKAVGRHVKPAGLKTKAISRKSSIIIGLSILVAALLYYFKDSLRSGGASVSVPSSAVSPAGTDSPDASPSSLVKECVDFGSSEKMNGLFFPVISSNNEKLEIQIANQFASKCAKYDFKIENRISEFHRGKALLYDQQKQIAQKCGADLYFGGQYLELGGQNLFDAQFGLVADSIALINASSEDFKLIKNNISLFDLTSGHTLDTLYENVLQALLGFLSFQNKDFQKTIQIMKDLDPAKIKNDSFRNVIYRVMSDACYQMGKKDSALIYLEKTKVNSFLPELELKKSLIATEVKQYDKAILAYSRLIDSSNFDKNVLYEKRADQYDSIKDYKKAQEDYKRVRPKSEIQKSRIQSKSQNIDTKINTNKAGFTDMQISTLSPESKLVLSEKLLQIGEAAKAQEVLKTIPANSITFSKASPLLLESQVKLNQVNVNTIPKSALEQNKRLKVAVKERQ